MTGDTGKLVGKISIFSDLAEDELKIALAALKEHSLEKSTILFNEGDPGDTLFIILSGHATVSVKLPDGGALTLCEMTSGSFLGEMSLIEGLPRSATCTIVENSTLLSLDKAGLAQLMATHPAIAEKILYRMLLITTSRLNDTGALVSDMVQWGEKAQLRVITDEFTGLYNRRFLDSAIQTEFRKATAEHLELSVAMVDLDHFGGVNKKYGEAFGDEVILKAAEAFKENFRKTDILTRYGGDEFTFLFPGTTGEKALELCSEACRKLAEIEFPTNPDFKLTASMGITSVSGLVVTVDELREQADKALYEAKETGRNRAVLHARTVRQKHAFSSLTERNRTVDRIFDIICAERDFLLLGHELPDEDCISSLVSMALLITKFRKNVSIYIKDTIPDQLSYMENICAYNKIRIIRGEELPEREPGAICVLDTPKPDMISLNDGIRKLLADPAMMIIELDHHLSADAAYSGRKGYCLVHRASSTCELIGFLCYKLERRQDILDRFGITEILTRNLVLAMLTGMIGDTRFGLTMKTNRDIFFYNFFSTHFANRLKELSHKDSTNYSSMKDIFNTIQTLSSEEKNLYQMILEHTHFYGRTGYVILEEELSRKYLAGIDYSIFVKVIKSLTDFLAEKSGTIGLTVYYDMPEISDLIQFRIRASREASNIDLRTILTDFSITDGGGHAGAIGFRVPAKDIPDLSAYVAGLLKKIESL
jgi:diguanylate cyclase (GGDEF)-like protein